MYSILLVEDEKIELDTLKDYIHWDKLMIDNVYTARNGRRAFECIVEYEPDIMITDIQMPIMTGIELAKKVREEGFKTKIIFLTGYDEFTYVKDAFHVQASDYILKPFMIEEMEELILRVEKQIDKEKTTEQSVHVAAKHIVERLCRGGMEEEEAKTLSKEYFKNHSSETTFGLAAIYGVEREDFFQKQSKASFGVYHSFWIGDVLLVILQNHLYFCDAVKRIQSIWEEKYTIGYYKDKIFLHDLEDRTKQLINNKDRIFFQPRGGVFEMKELSLDNHKRREKDSIHIQEKKEALIKLIKRGESLGMERAVKELLSLYAESKKEEYIKEVYELFYEVKNSLLSCDTQLHAWMRESEVCWQDRILKGRYEEDIVEEFLSYCNYILSFFIKQKEDSNYHIIARIKNYLEENYSRVCSVERMAEEVHLSPNYLRTIFKESMGQTILEYVTEYRLTKACELLKDRTLRVKEVGKLVGYDNESYFGTVFIKKYGVTPNEYRKMV